MTHHTATPRVVPSPSPRMIGEIDGAVGWLTVNHPERRNAVSLDMWSAMADIIDAFERDPAVRVVVIKGAGDKAFISGADISEFEQNRATQDQASHYGDVAATAAARLQGLSKPSIAMIRGYCIGGGVAVALGCDLRIAADTARFGVPAARIGISYSWRDIKKLMDLVGPAFAREIFYTGRQFTAVGVRIGDRAWRIQIRRKCIGRRVINRMREGVRGQRLKPLR